MSHNFTRLGLGLMLVLGASLSPAFATFHLMVVQEVFPGTASAPPAQYVLLRMTGSGQNFLSGTFIDVQDANGVVLGRFGTFDHNVANAGTLGCVYPNCPAIVIGTSAAQTLLGFSFDQIVDLQAGHVALSLPGGRLCFRSSTGSAIDCVAWGNYTGVNTIPTPTINGCDANFGAPAAALALDHALTRITFNCASKENSTDFGVRFPHPIANNGANANTDVDSDGLIKVLDCNDNDSTALYFPVEVSGDAVAAGNPTIISWDSQAMHSGSGVRYDIVGGLAADLSASMSFSGATCVSADVNGTSFIDTRPAPAAGQILYYLIRAGSSCGEGTFGDSSLTPDPRDGLDAASPCL